ncbi:MAG: cytochrome c biogenesis protein CcsA, partial [Chloroflexi bacterium]|nr:cytochrome c biogenesis protein CcsA [Chloroflexota bacterium]
MADLGSISLLLALALGIYSAAGSLLGVWKKNPQLVQSARTATYLAPMTLGVATASMVGAFVTSDFQVAYVAAHSSLAMDTQYIWVAFYAGNEGSLLFIAFVLSILSAIAIFFAPKVLQTSLPYTNMVLMVVLVFFVAVMIFLANPFSRLDFVPLDGQGINPLLTHPGMFIHPPMLMTGLISFTIPFAFAMGALLSGRTGDEWVDTGRNWGITAWTILGAGNLLGMWWAYTILGWGGYWGWDPVENSSFMPWIVMTAFIHSIMVQKRRGMFRMWNLVLIIIAFGFAQFGMFINRGGPVP